MMLITQAKKIKGTKTKIIDICDFKTVIDDDNKLNLIKKRKPCDTFKFQSQEFKDKRRPNGVMQRSCHAPTTVVFNISFSFLLTTARWFILFTMGFISG